MSSERLSTEFWLSKLQQHLNQERYSPQATQRCTVIARQFLTFLGTQRIAVEAVEPKDINLYLRHALRLYRRHHRRSPNSLHAPKSFQWWRYSYTTGIHMLLRLVHGHWPLPPTPRTSTERFHQEVCQQYERWMRHVRGLSLPHRNRSFEARHFMSWLGKRGSRQRLLTITVRDVDAYMMLRAASQRRISLKRCAGDLRRFLRYLHATARVIRDLSTAVTHPTLYAFEKIPSSLRPEQVEAVLKTTRKDRSQKGIRDYAILMLLSCYGLRAGEVTALQLDDVDWRNDVIRVRQSKTGANFELPLVPSVGNAILDYLRNGRPKTRARELFIQVRAPYRSFRNGSCLHRLVYKRLLSAGVKLQGKHGPHAFRHARAVSMLRAAVSAKEIGDVLGHRSASSTMAYLKLATEDLRSVALEIPAEVKA